MMNRPILFVDDEPKILQALERQLSGKFEVRTAPGGQPALEMLAQDGPYAVVVSDFRMPLMDGIQFLRKVKQLSPDTVRLMLTGQADLNTTIAAVNEGNIFRFLTKPCATEVLSAALDSALEQHRLINAERELLEKTLRGSIQVLTEVLSLTSPRAFNRACRIRRYVTHIASRLALKNAWELEIAAMLCQLGCISVPPEVLDKAASSEQMTTNEQEVFAAHPAVAEHLLETIPRLETVARIVRSQNETSLVPLDWDPPPDDLVVLGSAVLRVALEFDRIVTPGALRKAALAELRQSGVWPAPLIAALETVADEDNDRAGRQLKVNELDAGMIIDQDVHTLSGVLLLTRGQELTLPVIARLKSFDKTVGIHQPLSVLAARMDPD
jgi:response regulator RpfG family c-di-GMP phosphodiesterase